MKKELDEALVRDFPNFYRDRHASMHVTSMAFGFDVGDGWEPIIRRMSERIEAVILRMPAEERHFYRASQVKEKFGSLRVYIERSHPEINVIIDEAERETSRTCEECGGPGESHGTGWITTLCDGCRSGRDERKKKEWEEYARKKAEERKMKGESV